MTSSARIGWARRFGALVAAAAMTLAFVFGIPLAPGFTVGGVETAFGQEAEMAQRKARRVPYISEATFKQLAEAQDFIDVRDLDGAQAVLQGMLDRCRGQKCPYNGNEIGQIHNMLGHVHFSKEDYRGAIRHYEKVLEPGEDIPEGLKTITLYTLAQLYSVDERYEEAQRYMQLCKSKATCAWQVPGIGSDCERPTSYGEYLPIVKVAPVYPRRALTRGIEGFVLLEFVVTRTGAVRNPQVIESKPAGIFDRAAVSAALKFKYKPMVVNGEPVDLVGVRNKITFELQDG